MRTLQIQAEQFPLRTVFEISRGAKRHADVVLVSIREDGKEGRGECVPYARYGETITSVCTQIEAVRGELEAGADRLSIGKLLKPGAARNAIDCALWDLEAKRTAIPVWKRAGLPAPGPVVTLFTIGLGTPDEMADQAKAAVADRHFPTLKIKLGSNDLGLERARLDALYEAVPETQFLLDANEGWTLDFLHALEPYFDRKRITMLEQPFRVDVPSAHYGAAEELGIPLLADEGCHGPRDLDTLPAAYGAVNVKLDKSGGLTEALELINLCRERRLQVLVGCMVATSLAMAPAQLLAGIADLADLDGPLLLTRDREPGLTFEGARVHPPSADLWG